MFWIRVCLNNCSVICAVTLCYVQNFGIFRTLFIQVCSCIFKAFNIIRKYPGVMRHCKGMFRLIQTYSASFVTIAYYIISIFWALGYLEAEAYSKPCETLNRHIQNPAIARTVRTVHSGIYSAILGIFSRNITPTHAGSWCIRVL